jgi:hypothetical protein
MPLELAYALGNIFSLHPLLLTIHNLPCSSIQPFLGISEAEVKQFHSKVTTISYSDSDLIL